MDYCVRNVPLRVIGLLALLFVNCAAGDLLLGLEVPQFAFAGQQATLGCSFDLRATRLYSLKWYHNGTEFYRYVPTERSRPIRIQPSETFSLIEVFRNDHRVTLSLTHLAVAATGRYRCEVIAEHPSFRTEAADAPMTVLREPLTSPLLMGARESYDKTDLIKIGCRPRRPISQDHQPILQWYLEGSQAPPELLTPMVITHPTHTPGVTLTMPAQQIVEASSGGGNSLRVECRLTLGCHYKSSFRTLKLRTPLEAADSRRLLLEGGRSGYVYSQARKPLAWTWVSCALLAVAVICLQ